MLEEEKKSPDNDKIKDASPRQREGAGSVAAEESDGKTERLGTG